MWFRGRRGMNEGGSTQDDATLLFEHDYLFLILNKRSRQESCNIAISFTLRSCIIIR